MKKLVITGASGFVGNNLQQFIKSKNLGEISPLNFRQPLPETIIGDTIIHLAGKAHDLENSSNPKEYFEVNFEKTRELFDLFIKSECADFIHFSSVKAVADTVEGVLSEDVHGNPKTPYGQSKLKAEQYLLSQRLPEGKRLFIIRPCMIHGPGNKGNLNLLYNVVKKGIPYPLGAFENRRSLLSIDNLVFALDKIINDINIPGGVYNLADDRPMSTNEMVNVIAEGSGLKTRIYRINKGLVTAIARAGDIVGLPLNSERLKKLTETYVVSNEKIKKVLNIDHFPVSSREGLFKTIKSFQKI